MNMQTIVLNNPFLSETPLHDRILAATAGKK